MRKTLQSLTFLGAALAFLLMAVAVFLFHPGSYQALNEGSVTLQKTASLMFWVGLLLGLILQIISTVLRFRKNREFGSKVRRSNAKKSVGGRIFGLLFRSRMALAMAFLFIVGLIGSVVLIILDPIQNYLNFGFLALTILGLSEYLTFNSLNYLYSTRRRERHER